MTSTSDINIVLGQGNIVKEIQNVRRQDLELNQQFVAQKTKDDKEKEKSRVQEFETENKIEMTVDEEKSDREGPEGRQEKAKKRKLRDENDSTEGNIIDIKV